MKVVNQFLKGGILKMEGEEGEEDKKECKEDEDKEE